MEKTLIGNINPKRKEINLRRNAPLLSLLFFIFLVIMSITTTKDIALTFKLITISSLLFGIFDKKSQKLIITYKYMYYFYSYFFGMCIGIRKYDVKGIEWEYITAPNMSTGKKIKMITFYQIKKGKRKRIFSISEINLEKEELEKIITLLTS